MHVFGIDTYGKTYCIWVNDFSPFFYIKIPEDWKKQQIAMFVKEIVEKTKINIQDIVNIKPVSKKKLYGFDGNKNHRFVELKFINLLTFYKVRKLWYKEIGNGKENKEKKLLPNGYLYKGEKLYLYESDIPPLLKFFHIRNISPSGWISIPKKQVNNNFFFYLLTMSCDKTVALALQF